MKRHVTWSQQSLHNEEHKEHDDGFSYFLAQFKSFWTDTALQHPAID